MRDPNRTHMRSPHKARDPLVHIIAHKPLENLKWGSKDLLRTKNIRSWLVLGLIMIFKGSDTRSENGLRSIKWLWLMVGLIWKTLAENGPEISLTNQNRFFESKKTFHQKHESRTVNTHPNAMIYLSKTHTMTSSLWLIPGNL